MIEYIPVNVPLLDGNEKKYLNQCLDDGWISSEGPFVHRFETEFAQYVGRRYAVACTNGTAALDLAIASLNLPVGSEVIMPSCTIISCALSVVRAGLIPRLIDVDPKTYNAEVSTFKKAITSKTSALMPVHIYGLSSNLPELLKLAAEYDLKVVEDSAENIGSKISDQHCGSFGDVSTFSFYPNKLVTTGEGGMLLTDNLDIANSASSFRNLCFQKEKRFVHENLGWNYRMTNLQAALGLAQLESLARHLEKKQQIGTYYNHNLAHLSPQVQLPVVELPYTCNSYWVYPLVLRSITSETICKQLARLGIGTRPFFYPLHLQPALQPYLSSDQTDCPVALNLHRHGFYIPSGLGLTEHQMATVVSAITTLLT